MRYLFAICFTLHLLTSTVQAACLPVEGDHILGKDLAVARPEFAAIDPGVEIGFAPNPGVIRVFQVADLVALGQKFSIATNTVRQSVCFVRPANAAAAAPKPVTVKMDVQRGEQVAVEVLSGAALLRFLADAETSGHIGDSVLVRNPENGKLFQAKVEAKGKVMVQR